MIIIEKEKLFSTGTVNGVVRTLHLNLNDALTDDNTLQDCKNELRSILRCRQNLTETLDDLVIFKLKYYQGGNDPINSMSLEVRAILSHCLMLYRACFVKDRKGRRPLSSIFTHFEKKELHLELRELADKLIAHLDDDCEVKTDTILLNFEITETGLIPIKPELRFNKVLSIHSKAIDAWRNQILEIISAIDLRINEINETMAPLYCFIEKSKE